MAIENARLYRETLEKARLDQEMRIAAEIQQALLPKHHHVGKGFEAAAASLPCRSIGGDFFEYLDLADARFGFALGDVAGKGPPAALLSAMLQGFFAAESAAREGPAATVARINKALIRRAIENRFVTLLYGTLSADGSLTYCNAGHNPPLVVSASGVTRLEVGGPIVGLFDGVSFEEAAVQLQPGDWIVVFSDGVSEALNASGEEFGDDRIIACVQGFGGTEATALLASLFDTLRQFTAGAPQGDDVTALVLRYQGQGAS